MNIGLIEKQVNSLREEFSSCQGTCIKKHDGTTINNQHEFSDKYFPELEKTNDGFVLPKKFFLFKKRKFGPVTDHNYSMNLCHDADVHWEGRVQELNQYNFQLLEVESGRMRKVR